MIVSRPSRRPRALSASGIPTAPSAPLAGAPSAAQRFARVLVLAGLVLAPFAAGLAGCSRSGEPAQAQENGPKKREATRVRTTAVVRREMTKTLSTTTVVESEREIKVFPRASGVVTALGCEEGDRVAAGAVLAVLDRRQTAALVAESRVAVREAEDNVRKADLQKSEAESRIAAALLKHEQAVRDYERNEKANLISAQALDGLRVARDTARNEWEAQKLAAQRAEVEATSARTLLEKAKLALERQELEDSYMEITAPFAGVVAQRAIKVGDAVGAAAHAFVLTDEANLRAVFYRPQRELALFLNAPRSGGGSVGARAATGAPLEIRVLPEALPGSVFRGDLQLVSPSIDAQSGSFRVTVRLGGVLSGPPDARLLPGMLVRLEIVTERHPDALVVPKRALRREGERTLVYLVVDGHARELDVVEGFADDADVEVTPRASDARFAADARVIVVGNRELEDGAEVLEEREGGSPAATPVTPAANPATAVSPDGKG